MLGTERRSEIIRLLEENRVVKVSDLSQMFSVSEATIRRDLGKLARQGLLRKTYGGATVKDGSRSWGTLEAGPDLFLEEKRRIGRAAAELIEDGDTISLQAGSTTLQVAQCLTRRNSLTVLTNDIDIAHELSKSPGIRVNLSGGILREGTRILVGPLAEQAISQFHVDKAILGVSAISLTEGLTNVDLLDAQIKTAMIRGADEVIVVADHSKLGKVHFAKVAPITAIHKLVMDDGISPDDIEAFEANRVEVIVC
jgi:DeoR family fructose operon transcriptional repressor